MIRLIQPPAAAYRDLLKSRSLAGYTVIPDALPDWLTVDQGLRGLGSDPLCYRYGIPYLIVSQPRGVIVGNIGGKGWLPEEEEVELGYHTAEACRGRGIMTAAIAAFQNIAGADGVNLIAHVEPENKASRRVLQKNGFRCDALVRLPDSLALERWLWSAD